MPHTDQLTAMAKRFDGLIPPSWLTGDEAYQQAAVIAAMAWHTIKDPTDPELTAADLTFRENCIGVVESLMRGNDPDDTPFSQTAFRIWKEVTGPAPTTTKEIDHDRQIN